MHTVDHTKTGYVHLCYILVEPLHRYYSKYSLRTSSEHLELLVWCLDHPRRARQPRATPVRLFN